jgi:transcriptional regulator with XRE-family HTH domain
MIDPQQLQDAKHALGRKLAELRKARRLLQKDVAERVHSTRSTVAWLTRVRDWPATPTTPAAAACGKRRERRSC